MTSPASRPVSAAPGAARGGPWRVGLAGTGHWARLVHAPGIASAEGAEFAAVWGRNAADAAALAARYGARAHSDFDEFLAGLDAVAFAVPPDVQAGLAVRAAQAGRHLLLEKPIATSLPAALDLVRAVEESGVASVVFFTARFQDDVRSWLADVRTGQWTGGAAMWLGTALEDSSPFNTPWRRVKGGLWDLAPHLVSLFWASLGPVRSVTADAGPADVTHLVLHHEGGATSTMTVTLSATEAAAELELYLWGASGRSEAPSEADLPQAAYRTALADLAAAARGGLPSDCDVRFGYEVTAVLADAEQQLSQVRSSARS
jgi:predicted dehydrogenase